MVPRTKSIIAKKVTTKDTTEEKDSKVRKSSKSVGKKPVVKRNVGIADLEYREKVTVYKNSRPGEAPMHCSFCIASGEKKVFLGKGRFVIKHMLKKHGVHAMVSCSYDTCTWACGMGLEHFQKDHCYHLSVDSKVDENYHLIF